MGPPGGWAPTDGWNPGSYLMPRLSLGRSPGGRTTGPITANTTQEDLFLKEEFESKEALFLAPEVKTSSVWIPIALKQQQPRLRSHENGTHKKKERPIKSKLQ